MREQKNANRSAFHNGMYKFNINLQIIPSSDQLEGSTCEFGTFFFSQLQHGKQWG